MHDSRILKIVYFVRHGESEQNATGVFQSHETSLSEKGKFQTQNIAMRVSQLSFETLISSPWERTKATARAISETTGKIPEYSSLFVERKKPIYFNGKSRQDTRIDKAWKEWEEKFYNNVELDDNEGENYNTLISRADEALNFLSNRPEESMVVVTHGFFLKTMIVRVLLGDLLTKEIFKRFQKTAFTENTGLTVLLYQKGFEGDTRWRLWVFNDHAHLG